MGAVTKRALLEPGLERAAEALGDVTAPVMAAFYASFPEAEEAFVRHSLGRKARLEAEMVAQALYCLLTWFEHPAEVSGVLAASVPHHEQTLGVRPEWYQGLLATTAKVLGAYATAEEAQAWQTIEAELCETIRDAGQ